MQYYLAFILSILILLFIDSSFPFDTPWRMPFSLFSIVLATFFIMGAALYDSPIIDRTAFLPKKLFILDFCLCNLRFNQFSAWLNSSSDLGISYCMLFALLLITQIRTLNISFLKFSIKFRTGAAGVKGILHRQRN
ncbi:hypothetical protein E1470_c44130 [Escherichia coli ECC-1470]|nr:hypothetical protein E1470_c44130 [Escherichia coli ECC-1470]